MVPSPLNVLSLFAGIGGLDLGVGLAFPGARTVCYVEREGPCVAVLLARMADGGLDPAPVWSDVETFDGRPWRGVVDCVSAGFPCQDVSNAGKRMGLERGQQTGLWFECARIIRDVGPHFVVLENVPGLVRRGMSIVLGDLAEMGFAAEWGCLRADAVGASHRRERWFLVAVADSVRRMFRVQETEKRQTGVSVAVAGKGVVHADRERKSQQTWRVQLADSMPAKLEIRLGERPDDVEKCAPATGGGGSLVDPGADELEITETDLQEAGQSSPGGGDSLFAPSPGDTDGWQRLLDLDPTVEPAIRGNPPWAACRLDRLRSLGNSVVPLQAAVAIRLLAARLGVDQ